MLLVIKETDATDTPHVVDEVGAIETHTPSLFSRRESAQHQQLSMPRHKRLEGM
jgi:hypothetical protein